MKIKLRNCNFPKLSITSTEDKAQEAMCIAGGVKARHTSNNGLVIMISSMRRGLDSMC
ncbi:hypothetical protein N480_18440 [Pseudoalteromonas luteoviolacea S2607]|uniref:hypothetical protein n=1 Tax=Pseudoalteromonas luteoviolacea TaxID=43657 RepID=UPI0007B174A6|nr:hypothetical protein [Pseudoalteromonas luteoviolacea]KZN35970.1 hypothetical protein N480_18440 [Pseudoalteromonas luteoviolacea S2607]